jgi:hypothetical protein
MDRRQRSPDQAISVPIKSAFPPMAGSLLRNRTTESWYSLPVRQATCRHRRSFTIRQQGPDRWIREESACVPVHAIRLHCHRSATDWPNNARFGLQR